MDGQLNRFFAWLQNYGVRVTLWLIVTLSFAAIATKAVIGKPSSAPVHYLLIIALIAAVLAVLVPNFESYLLSKISEIDIAGVKLVIAKAPEIKRGFDFKRIKPSELSPSDPVADGPFRVAKLEGFQLYEYEKWSNTIYKAFEDIREPNDLDDTLRQNYRELIKHVAKMAYAMGHYSKCLDIIVRLEKFKDGLSDEELADIGYAYLWAADEQLDEAEKKEFWKKSVGFLKRAVKENSHEVKSIFNLGIGHLYLNHYRESIRFMKWSARMSDQLIPWIKWNLACAYVRLKKEDEALTTLKEIDKGKLWKGIRGDTWFTEDSVSDEFRAAFHSLCDEKLA